VVPPQKRHNCDAFLLSNFVDCGIINLIFHLGGVIICKLSKILTAFVSIIALFSCINSYAANIDYLNAVNWSNNKHIYSANIEKKSANDIMYGEIRYLKDNDNLTIYTYFSVSETSLLYDYSDDIRVIYEVEAAEAKFTFTINSEGIEDEFGQSEEIFDCGSNIYYEASALQALTYAHYTGKSSEIKVRVYLAINSSRYLALDTVKLKVPETTTKTKETTTKKFTTKKSVSSTNKTSKKSSDTKTKKFSISDKTDGLSEDTGKVLKPSNKTSDAYNRGEMPQNAKILLIVGIIILLIGIIIAAFYAGRSTKNEESQDENADSNK